MMPDGGAPRRSQMLIMTPELTYRGLLTPSREYLMGLVEPGPKPRPVSKVYKGDPGIYGRIGQSSVMCVSHVGDVWTPRMRERPHLPGATDWTVAFKTVALKRANPGAKWQSAVEDATDVTELAFSEFLEGLGKNPRMDGSVMQVDVLDVDAGDADRVGNVYVDMNNPDNQLLWALSARVRIVYVD